MRLALVAALALSIAPPSLSDDIDRRAAEVDAKLKDSAPVLETFSLFVGELIAGA